MKAINISLKRLAVIIVTTSVLFAVSNSVLAQCTQTVTYCELQQTKTATSCPNVADWVAEGSLAPQYSSSAVDVLGLFGDESAVVSFSGFGFAIPVSKSICRVEASITRRLTSSGIAAGEFVVDNSVRVNGGANLAVAGNWPTTATAQVYNAGASFTPASVNAGVTVSLAVNAGAFLRIGGSTKANVSAVTVSVYVSRTAVVSVPCPLPTTLEEFKGEQNGTCVDLSWTTQTELNNDHFIVEKMVGDKFVAVGTVDSKSGDEQGTLNYTFTDCDVTEGNYYRLVQVDTDGKTEVISDLINVPVSFKMTDDILLAPNPAKDIVTVRATSAMKEYQLLAADGKLMVTETLPEYTEQVRLDVSEFNSGIYHVVVYTANGVLTERLVVE